MSGSGFRSGTRSAPGRRSGFSSGRGRRVQWRRRGHRPGRGWNVDLISQMVQIVPGAAQRVTPMSGRGRWTPSSRPSGSGTGRPADVLRNDVAVGDLLGSKPAEPLGQGDYQVLTGAARRGRDDSGSAGLQRHPAQPRLAGAGPWRSRWPIQAMTTFFPADGTASTRSMSSCVDTNDKEMLATLGRVRAKPSPVGRPRWSSGRRGLVELAGGQR